MTNEQAEADAKYQRTLQRWDMHTDRQVAAAKGAVTAVTILNSGSWLALLSQAGSLAAIEGASRLGPVFQWWGSGAFFGTLPWVFLYLNTNYTAESDLAPNGFTNWGIHGTRYLGIISALVSLVCFAAGVIAVSKMF